MHFIHFMIVGSNPYRSAAPHMLIRVALPIALWIYHCFQSKLILVQSFFDLVVQFVSRSIQRFAFLICKLFWCVSSGWISKHNVIFLLSNNFFCTNRRRKDMRKILYYFFDFQATICIGYFLRYVYLKWLSSSLSNQFTKNEVRLMIIKPKTW